jgi:hypothetical protein
MRTYRHYRPRNVWIPVVLFAAIGLGGLIGLAWCASRGFDSEPPFPVFVMLLVIAGINLALLGRSAVEVQLQDDGHLSFRGPLRSSRVAVLDILSLEPSQMSNGGLFVLKHRHGSLRFDPRLNGMHELVAELKRLNPQMVVRGI